MIDGYQSFWIAGYQFLFQRDPLVQGAVTTTYPLIDLGVIQAAKPTHAPKKATLYDAKRGVRRIRAIRTLEYNESHALTLSNFNEDNLNLMHYGSGALAFTQVATPVTGSATQPGFPGRLMKVLDNTGLAVYNIASIEAVKKGATSLTAGTDYELADADVGLIRILSGGSVVVDGDLLTINYTPVALSGKRLVRPHAGGTIRGKGYLIWSRENGDEMTAREFVCELDTTDVNMQSTDFSDWKLDATVIDDLTNPTQPGGRILSFKSMLPALS